MGADKDDKAANGDGETDPKAPLANLEDDEDIGDPVPANVQAALFLCGIVGAIMISMGLSSSEWVIAVEGFYWQGLFIYCAGSGYNATDASAETTETSVEPDDHYEVGCKRIDLDNQGYTMGAALFVSISLSTNIFGVLLALLATWVRDIDSKRKSYKLALYLFIISVLSNFLSLFIYGTCFGDVMEGDDDLGPFEDAGDWWEVGWSFEINVTALVFQFITTLCVGYSLLLLPIIEIVDEEEETAEK